MFPGVSRCRIARLLALAAALAAAGVAHAHAQEIELISPETLTLAGDARIVAVDGERAWLDGALGKLRFGPGDGGRGPEIGPQLAEADLIWQPRLGWALSGTFVAIAQQGQEHAVDLSEAALAFKPLLPGPTRITVRAGLYWPAVSLEHSGPEWAVTETITPSAINSWIGEEVKVGGVEATLAAPLGSHRVAVTLGAFGFNDTSGTLLAFRGWALHDEKAVAFGHQPLPPRNAAMQTRQAPVTEPVREIDHRVGWYGKLGWSPSEAFELQLFHYDNRGNPEAVTPGLQWGWQTRFTDIGAIASLGAVEVKAQAMGGRTRMGFPRNGVVWSDTSFHSAFLLATRRFDRGSVSARVEAFSTTSRGSLIGPEYSEDGWAITAAARRAIGARLTLLAEFLHVESDRAARADLGLAPRQRQNQFQLAVRVRL